MPSLSSSRSSSCSPSAGSYGLCRTRRRTSLFGELWNFQCASERGQPECRTAPAAGGHTLPLQERVLAVEERTMPIQAHSRRDRRCSSSAAADARFSRNEQRRGHGYPGQLRKSPRREQGPESQCRDYYGSLQHLRQGEERASRRVLLWLQSGPRVSSQDQWRNFPSFIRPSGFPSSTREGRGKERRERKRESAECSSAVATVSSATTSTCSTAECP